jgi:tetratricopeptide (TPR) repeat protein
MRKVFPILTLGLFAAIVMAADPEASYQAAMKAVATKDFQTALTELESAVSADGDSIKYASEYRVVVIQAKEHDRAIKFFEKAVAEHANSANLWLNYGFAYVDKIPVAGSITQVLLANTALSHFTKSIELNPTWIAYYTRGNSYLYWPKIFGRAPLALADLEQAMKIQKADQKRSYHVRAWISLGDAYWKTDQLDKAKATWKAGLDEFADSEQLKARLARDGDDLKTYIDDVLDPNKRVDTNLKELWMDK